MSNPELMTELHRLMRVDYIKNQISSRTNMLAMAAMDKTDDISNQEMIANDDFLEKIITDRFASFSEKYDGTGLDPIKHGGKFSAAEMLADPDGAALIAYIEGELNKVHEKLLELLTDTDPEAFAKAEKMTMDKINELVNYCEETKENTEVDQEIEAAQSGGKRL